jgi:hypothetical protein
VGLFELFGIGPEPLWWTYAGEGSLLEALNSCVGPLSEILTLFERAALGMCHAGERGLEEFPGPRPISARAAHELALPLVRKLAPDAALIQLRSMGAAAGASASGFGLPLSLQVPVSQGKLADRGAWLLQYYSQQRQLAVNAYVPCRGEVEVLRSHQPRGSHWPSDAGYVLCDGWLDSDKALEVAKAAAATALNTGEFADDFGYDLSSRTRPGAPKDQPAFQRAGPSKEQQAWRISFKLRASEGPSRDVAVALPADGNGEAVVSSNGQ